MENIALIAVATATVVVVAAILFTKARSLRIGFFVERERFDMEQLERGFDEEDTVEIEPLRYRQKFPPEEDK